LKDWPRRRTRIGDTLVESDVDERIWPGVASILDFKPVPYIWVKNTKVNRLPRDHEPTKRSNQDHFIVVVRVEEKVDIGEIARLIAGHVWRVSVIRRPNHANAATERGGADSGSNQIFRETTVNFHMDYDSFSFLLKIALKAATSE
jgi:hypothetical protein